MPQIGLEPRKKPKQIRSMEMNKCILEASARLLKEAGPQNLTTNRIAKVAGISVGSLYQYYPNKESILAALIETDFTAKRVLAMEKFKKIINKPAHEVIREMIELAIELNTMNPELTKLFDLSSLFKKQEVLHNTDRLLVQFLAQYSEVFKDQLKTSNMEIPLFIILNSVKAMSGLMSVDQDYMNRKKEITDELVKMACDYLLKTYSSRASL